MKFNQRFGYPNNFKIDLQNPFSNTTKQPQNAVTTRTMAHVIKTNSKNGLHSPPNKNKHSKLIPKKPKLPEIINRRCRMLNART